MSLNLGWRSSQSSHLPVETARTISSNKKEDDNNKNSVTGELVGGRVGGKTGRHCVSSSPFCSFTQVPFWPLGGKVAKEGVRNVLLLRHCGQERFVCRALQGWISEEIFMRLDACCDTPQMLQQWQQIQWCHRHTVTSQ